MDTKLWQIEQLIKASKALSNALANVNPDNTTYNIQQLDYDVIQGIYRVIHDLTAN